MPELSYSRFTRVYISIGAIFTAIQAYVLITFKIPLKQALLDAGLNNALILLSGIGTYHVLKNYKPARDSMVYPRILVLLQTIIISVVFNATMRGFYATDTVYLAFIEQSNLIRLVYILLNVSLMSVFVFLLFYFKDEQNKQQHIVDAEKLTREAELVSLRQQLQPHFLFNSLNSISALVGTRP